MPDSAKSLPYPTQTQIMEWVRIKFPTKTSVVHRAMKLGEEAGEVLGAVTKMDEGRKTKADLGQELAQAVICCMGVAEAAGIDLDQEVRREWDRAGRPVLDVAPKHSCTPGLIGSAYGCPVCMPETSPTEPVVDLMAALEASLARAKEDAHNDRLRAAETGPDTGRSGDGAA